jgi:hypothetical protein
VAGGWKCYTAGQNNIRAEWTAEKLAISETSRMREKAAQIQNEKVDHDYQNQKARAAADKRIVDDRLREYAAASSDTSSGATGRVDDPYRAITDQCTVSIAELDGYAKGVASKAIALQGYVSNVCLEQKKNPAASIE